MGKSELLKQFVDSDVIDSLGIFLDTSDQDSYTTAAKKISCALGADSSFSAVCDGNSEAEEKFLTSFKKNLTLLVQKTWVEKYDESSKEAILYKLENYCKDINEEKFLVCYGEFLEILDSVVALMFGNQPKNPDFMDYAIRIDPEFGIYWWYVSSLPRKVEDINWSNEKLRLSLCLAMVFLSNY